MTTSRTAIPRLSLPNGTLYSIRRFMYCVAEAGRGGTLLDTCHARRTKLRLACYAWTTKFRLAREQHPPYSTLWVVHAKLALISHRPDVDLVSCIQISC
eukprot:4652688-Pleurochrysis_carterae.AAC.2